jgi:hypothetical protein
MIAKKVIAEIDWTISAPFHTWHADADIKELSRPSTARMTGRDGGTYMIPVSMISPAAEAGDLFVIAFDDADKIVSVELLPRVRRIRR